MYPAYLTRCRRFTSALAGLAALAACSKPAPDPRTAAPLVRVGTATTAAETSHAFTGIVGARSQSDLGFRVGGKVIERLVNAGQTVRRGQPLMRLDRTDLTLATTSQGGTVSSIQATAVQASAEEQRYRDLVAAGAVSALTYDQAKARSDSARAQFAAALAQARVARNAESYSVLRADADGTVVETLAEAGQVVSSGQVVVRLAQAGPREAIVSLPETIRPRIGSMALATVYAGGSAAPARLRQLSDAADPRTRTFEARYVLQGSGARAPLGSTVTVDLPDAQATGRLLQVPLSAIYDNGRGPGLWIIGRDAAVRFRRVRLAGVGAEAATILSGLREGERFVALGAHLLHEGERVKPMAQRSAGR